MEPLPENARLVSPKRVLIVVEDAALAELLSETLVDAGHAARIASPEDLLANADYCSSFEVVLVDLDMRAGAGVNIVGNIRRDATDATVVALLPCGATPNAFKDAHFHLAIEKPARLSAVLAAVDAAPSGMKPGEH